jgi:hypothetical protein
MAQCSTLIVAASTADARLNRIARDLARDLTRVGIEAREVDGATAVGDRGDLFVLGQLSIGLVTSGAVTALIECLKAYIARERTLTVRVRRTDGSEVEVSARNVSDSASERALRAALQPS